MKNIYVMSALVLSLGLMTSCDPNKDEGTFVVDNFTADSMMEGATFSQYNDAECTQPAEDGNYIKYSIPKLSAVTIFYKKADGSEMVLDYGKNSGVFNYVPLRGSDPVQTLYFRYINPDLKEVVAEKNFTLQVAQELSAEVKLLTSNAGSKVWKWDPDYANGGRVWGNAGNSGGAWDGSSIWWGCGLNGDENNTGDDFTGQMQHSGTGNSDEVTYGAYMVFNEDGTVTKYGASGAAITTSSFAVTGWNGGEQDNWVAAKLEVSPNAEGNDSGILFPFYINSGGTLVKTFNISILTADQLQLTYYENDPGSWGETTWWRFASNSDYEGMLQGSSSKSWTWDPDYDNDGRVWGNAGNAGGTWDGTSIWWGCGVNNDPDNTGGDFTDQMGHSGTGNTDEVTFGAYMTFFDDGTVAKYGPDGNLIVQTPYSVEGWKNGDQENWVAGKLIVASNAEGTDCGILFPFFINSGGTLVGSFNISLLTSKQLQLTYYENDPGSWGETTWWRFKAKE